MKNEMVKVVNVVGSGSLGIELHLKAVADDLGDLIEYDPDKYPGAYVRFGDSEPLITFYRTGKFITTGAGSEEEAYNIRNRFLHLLTKAGVLETPGDEWFDIQNLVCVGELHRALNLNALAIGLSLEKTEYEPEQFPGLVYRPVDTPCVVLLFSSGKVVLTGCPNIEVVKKTFESVRSQIESVLPSE